MKVNSIASGQEKEKPKNGSKYRYPESNPMEHIVEVGRLINNITIPRHFFHKANTRIKIFGVPSRG
jgi:hypothetical protein